METATDMRNSWVAFDCGGAKNESAFRMGCLMLWAGSCQIPSVQNKGPEGPVFICLISGLHSPVASKWAQSLVLRIPSPAMGRGWATSQENREETGTSFRDISFAKLWRAISEKEWEDFGQGSKRANLELRERELRKRENHPNKIFKCSSYGVH